MLRTSLRPYYLMGALIALLLAVSAGAGLLNPGIYSPYMVPDLLAGMPVQDGVSLVAALLLPVAMLRVRRGSSRALIVWAGLLVYVLYYYAFLAFGLVYTAVYPLYLALEALCLYSLIGLLASVDVPAFAKRASARMPVRLIAVVLGMALLFTPIWLAMMAQGIAAQKAPAAALVFVIDLCFMIPAMVYAAMQIWRRRAVGYLLAGVLLVKEPTSGILLTGGTLRQAALGFPIAMEQLAMYIFLAVAGGLGLALYLLTSKTSADRSDLRARRAQPVGQAGAGLKPRAERAKPPQGGWLPWLDSGCICRKMQVRLKALHPGRVLSARIRGSWRCYDERAGTRG